MKFRKIMAAGTAAVTLAGMMGLAGCSGDVAQESEPKVLKVWHYEEDTSARGQSWQKAMDEFEKDTGVKIEFEKKSFEQIRQNASQILNSDEVPDVMEYNKGNATAGVISSQGLLTNLDDYVAQYGWDKVVTGSLSTTCRYDDKGVMGSGHWWGITNDGEYVMMLYNKDMFDKYGIAIPTTMNELEDAMQKFVDNGITPLSESAVEYPLGHLLWQLVLQNADEDLLKAYEMYDGDVDWNNPALVNAVQTIKDWVEKGYISKNATGLKAEDAGQNWMNGTSPMFLSGTWWFGRFKSEITNMNWTMAKFPETSKVVGSAGNLWVIPENSPRKDLAAKFIDYTLRQDVQDELGNTGGLPIASDPVNITDTRTKELITSFNDIIKNDEIGFYIDWPASTLYDDINASLQELINGTTDVQGFMDQWKNAYTTGVETAGVK